MPMVARPSFMAAVPMVTSTGKFDVADYTVWRNSLGAGGAGSAGSVIPEPSALALSILAGAALCRFRPFFRFRCESR